MVISIIACKNCLYNKRKGNRDAKWDRAEDYVEIYIQKMLKKRNTFDYNVLSATIKREQMKKSNVTAGKYAVVMLCSMANF